MVAVRRGKGGGRSKIGAGRTIGFSVRGEGIERARSLRTSVQTSAAKLKARRYLSEGEVG